MNKRLLASAGSLATAAMIAMTLPISAEASTPPPILAAAVTTSAAHASPAVAYADSVIHAWGHGDRTAVAKDATANVVTKLFANAKQGGSHWVQTWSNKVDGVEFVDFANHTMKTALTLAVNATGLAQGKTHDAFDVWIAPLR
ncbi:MAG: hypothetical protein ABI382_05920 [Nakamurella sp.]